MIDYKEFKTKVSKLTKSISTKYNEDDFAIDNDQIVQRHLIGGAEGGNCWGNNAEYFSNNYSALKFLPLDLILKEFVPQISYLGYKDIESLIVEDSYHESEYYGNYRDYTLYKLDIKKLYDTIFP